MRWIGAMILGVILWYLITNQEEPKKEITNQEEKPIIECTIKDADIIVGKVVYDLNDSNVNFLTEYNESVIRWRSYTNSGDKKIHFVNRITGTYTITLIDPAGKEHSFRGECIKGLLKQKF